MDSVNEQNLFHPAEPEPEPDPSPERWGEYMKNKYMGQGLRDLRNKLSYQAEREYHPRNVLTDRAEYDAAGLLHPPFLLGTKGTAQVTRRKNDTRGGRPCGRHE